ncbi:hypothetical protein, partial [Rhodoblastus sp.]|uniref:hypothetical protein n=1 Tax=Rhodoblastus sp. TaxID=1962975 RepID=UPI003F95F69C
MSNRRSRSSKRQPIGRRTTGDYDAKPDESENKANDEAPVRAQPIEQKGWLPEEREHHKTEQRYWLWSTVLTALAVMGAIATVILSKWSLEESQKAVAEARRATGEAHRQADATESQIVVAKDIEQRQLRAYVGIKRNDHIIILDCPACDKQVSLNKLSQLNSNAFRLFLKN